MSSGIQRFRGLVLAFLSIVVVATGLAADEAATRFGFTGPEIFPIDNSMSHLRAADLDRDGWNDLIVVNNNQSKIHLLYNQTAITNRPPRTTATGPRELNELPPDARFRIESIASEKRISSFAVEDLDGGSDQLRRGGGQEVRGVKVPATEARPDKACRPGSDVPSGGDR